MPEFIRNPSSLLRRRIKRKAELIAFDIGRMAMAFELMTQIRILESQTVFSVVEVQPLIAALHTILVDTGLDGPEMWEQYDRLSASRRPVFVPHEPSLSDTVASVPHEASGRSDESSSPHVEPDAALVLPGNWRELLQERQSPPPADG